MLLDPDAQRLAEGIVSSARPSQSQAYSRNRPFLPNETDDTTRVSATQPDLQRRYSTDTMSVQDDISETTSSLLESTETSTLERDDATDLSILESDIDDDER